MSDNFEAVLNEFANSMRAKDAQIQVLEESLRERSLQIEDVGWQRIGELGNSDFKDGLDLTTLKLVSAKLRELVDSHPLFKRGAQLRNSYIFGRGMSFTDVDQPRVQKALNDTHNKSVLFSVEGYEIANKALFTDGLFTVLMNKSTRHFITVPLDQVSGFVTNPDDDMDIWYVQRSWGENKVKWYPTGRDPNPVKSIDDGSGQRIPVDNGYTAYLRHANRQTGWTLGLPDGLAAMLWAAAYDAYLMDNAKLVKALSQIAWRITQPNKAAVTAAASRVEGSSGGIGGTAVSTGDLSSVGVPSAQVNFGNGQPLAAMVASSFGVPVIALLSSPGATGGSYGSAMTLDTPTIKGFEALQDTWSAFYEALLQGLGAREGKVAFPSIESDATYRQISSIAQMVELKIIWPDEAREAALDLMDVVKMHDTVPPQDEPDEDNNADGSSDTVVSKQGVSSKLGSTQNPGGDTNHDGDADNE